MFDRVSLTHPCGTVVDLVALVGVWTTPRGRIITHCEGCGEWLGSAFVQATEFQPGVDLQRNRNARLGPALGPHHQPEGGKAR